MLPKLLINWALLLGAAAAAVVQGAAILEANYIAVRDFVADMLVRIMFCDFHIGANRFTETVSQTFKCCGCYKYGEDNPLYRLSLHLFRYAVVDKRFSTAYVFVIVVHPSKNHSLVCAVYLNTFTISDPNVVHTLFCLVQNEKHLQHSAN